MQLEQYLHNPCARGMWNELEYHRDQSDLPGVSAERSLSDCMHSICSSNAAFDILMYSIGDIVKFDTHLGM